MLKVLSILFVVTLVLSGCGEITGNKLPAEAEASLREFIEERSDSTPFSFHISTVRKASNDFGVIRHRADEIYCVTIDPALVVDKPYYSFTVERSGLLWETHWGIMQEDFLRMGCDNWRE